jgi:hypothetical protein
VKVYHRTLPLEDCDRRAFPEGRGGVASEELLVGVWVSTVRPEQRAAAGTEDPIVELDIPGSLFERYEWVDESKPFREALIPAAVLHRYGRRPWVEAVESAEEAEAPTEAPARRAGGRRRPRRADRSSSALRAAVAVSVVFAANRAWKRRPGRG